MKRPRRLGAARVRMRSAAVAERPDAAAAPYAMRLATSPH